MRNASHLPVRLCRLALQVNKNPSEDGEGTEDASKETQHKRKAAMENGCDYSPAQPLHQTSTFCWTLPHAIVKVRWFRNLKMFVSVWDPRACAFKLFYCRIPNHLGRRPNHRNPRVVTNHLEVCKISNAIQEEPWRLNMCVVVFHQATKHNEQCLTPTADASKEQETL